MAKPKDEKIKLLINELELINKFVAGHLLLEKAWLGVLQKGLFWSHNGFITSEDNFVSIMFDNYTNFIHWLPIGEKVKYIKFYEQEMGKTWLQLTNNIINRDFSIDKSPYDPDVFDKEWWRYEVKVWSKDLKLNNGVHP